MAEEITIVVDDTTETVTIGASTAFVSSDINTLAKLNAIVADATIIDDNSEAVALNTAKVTFPEAPSDGTPYARQDAGWVAAAGGGGGATLYYRWAGIIDSPSTSNWVYGFKTASTVNFADEYSGGLGIAKGSSLITASFQSNYRIFAMIIGNQTITGFNIHTAHGLQPDYVGMVICRGGYDGVTFQYATQIEALNIAFTPTRMVTSNIAPASFTDTTLLDGDVIYLFWGSTTPSDIGQVRCELIATLD